MAPTPEPLIPNPRWLDPEEDRAWRGWLLMSDLLRWQLFRDLHDEAGLSDADFAVLVHLSEAADNRLRMSDLATALRWSKSRLSHQFTRMEARGLVRRENCSEDGRTTYAVLNDCGQREITKAAPAHVASVRRNFIDLLDRDQLAGLAEVADTVSRHLLAAGSRTEHGAPPCPVGADPAALDEGEPEPAGDGPDQDDPPGACPDSDLLTGP